MPVNGEAELPSLGGIVLPLEDLKRVRSAELLKYHLGQCERGGVVDVGEKGGN